MKRLAVLGAGSWGTALAVHWARAQRQRDSEERFEVVQWARRDELAQAMRR
ncbi:MAG: hypothetical protein AAGN46_17380, partial [Acidobacteriota bacterium]